VSRHLFGGVFGGTIDLLHKITYRESRFYLYDEHYSRGTFWLLILRSGLVGIGGAIALTAIRIYAGELEQHLEDLPRDVVYNFALSLIAGFAARTLLPNIANILERRLQEQDQKIAAQSDVVGKQEQALNEQGQTLEETRKELDQQKIALDQQHEEIERRKAEQNMAEKLFRGTTALNQNAVHSDINTGKNSLAEVLQTNKSSKTATILLARIFYEKENDVDNSIKVMDDFLYNNPLPPASEQDVADILYNKACYLALKAARFQPQEGAASTETENLRKEALLALERSISLSPGNARDAADDRDFDSIRDSEQFKRLV
jgi:hypothetical protein